MIWPNDKTISRPTHYAGLSGKFLICIFVAFAVLRNGYENCSGCRKVVEEMLDVSIKDG